MLETIMMFKLIWRNWRWLWYAVFHKDTIQERLAILISFCCKFIWSTRMPKITTIEHGYAKLLQKYNGAVFWLTV